MVLEWSVERGNYVGWVVARKPPSQYNIFPSWMVKA